MINLLKFLLQRQQKHSPVVKPTTGFTLIELLIGMVLATLVVTPLMAFMLNIMDNENKEKAKATSEQELQSAIDFIAEDLKQAIYIYDADGLNNNSTDATGGIKNQIPPVAEAPGCKTTTPTCVPVLVFWKRELRQGVLPVTGSTAKDDTFVYSLVAYYLVKGEISTGTWSDAARISRFQIKNGVINPTAPTNDDGTPNYIENPNDGFQLFNLAATGITLKEKMNRWRKTNVNYEERASVLVDFIDQSTITPPSCPTNTQRVPSAATLPGFFYVCVNSSTTSAQVFLRGNALARIEKNTTYSDNKSIYFPTASIQVKGLGLLGIE